MGPSRSCWNGTSSLQPEEITSKGQEFHVFTINKSAHTKKKSGNLLKESRNWFLLQVPYLFLVLWKCPSTYLTFRFLSFSVSGLLGLPSPLFSKFPFSFLQPLGLIIWSVLCDLFLSQNPGIFCVSFSRTDSGLCTYHLWYVQISIPCTVDYLLRPIVSSFILFCANLLHSLIM